MCNSLNRVLRYGEIFLKTIPPVNVQLKMVMTQLSLSWLYSLLHYLLPATH